MKMRMGTPMALACGSLLVFGLACSGVRGADSSVGSVGVGVDSEDTPDAESSGPCPAYFGLLEEGQWRSYAFNEAYSGDNGIQGGWTQTVIGVTEEPSGLWIDVEAVYDYTFDEGPEDYASTAIYTFVCDDQGAWNMGYDRDYSYTEDGVLVESWSEVLYDGGWLTVPWALEPGGGWTAQANSVVTRSDGSSESNSLSQEHEVLERVELQVPAGSFDALELSYTSEGVEGSYWLHEDLGQLRNSVADLVDYGG